MTTEESIIVNTFKKKDFLPNIIEFFTQKTTYFLTSRINPDILSNIEIILCFKDFSEKHVVSEIVSRNNRARVSSVKIIPVNEIEESLRYQLGDNSKCLTVLDDLIDCIKKNSKNDDCDIYSRYKIRENYDWDKPMYDNYENRIIIDHLGLYIYSNGNYRSGKIILFCDKIISESRSQGAIEPIDLFKVVLIHELAHAFHHLGIDSKDKTNVLFDKFDQGICEGFANFMVDLYIKERVKTNETESNHLSYAFEYGTYQKGAYSVYKDWIKAKYSIKAINAANNDYRDMPHASGWITINDYEKIIDWYKTSKNY